jgi:uncharacterized repeat protein (TIGR01451 family)
VTSVTAEVWGGGGAGGGQNQGSDGGGGGGGGAYSKKNTITVVPGNSYTVSVGLGGVGIAGITGGNGGDSYFVNATTVMAKGGIGGSPSTGTPPAGGAGGAASSGVGDVKYDGGRGGRGRDNSNGLGAPGGSSAGTASNGVSGTNPYSTQTPGTPPTGGGIGGEGGGTWDGTLGGWNGAAPVSGNGGGGGGSDEGSGMLGGDGAPGKVILTYTGPPTAVSINRISFNPASANQTVSWLVTFSESVTGVDSGDFSLIQTGGVTGATVTSVSGSGTTRTVTVGTGTGAAGALGLNLLDNETITSVAGSVALGGAGPTNGNFTGQTYTLIATVCTGAADILFCDDFERANVGSVGNGWTVTPANAGNCSGTAGNTACAGIDSDIPPFNTYANPRPNPSRAMFTRWAVVSVDSKVIDLSVTTGAQLSFWIRRGRDTFSECPEASGENYLVQYYASNNTWKTLAQYPSSPTAAACDGKIFTPTIELPPDALHAGFKMRFYQPSGSGDDNGGTGGGATGVVGYDYWHMDDVVIRKITAPTYVGAFCDNFEAGLSRWSISAEDYSSGNIGDASIGSIAYQSPNYELDMGWGYVTASTFKTNLTGVSGNITFWVKSGTGTRDPTTNQNLVVEYLNSAGGWTTLKTYLGTLAAGSVDSFSVALPADAKHAGFRLRFRQLAGSGYLKSYWHIDDVCVGNAVATSDMALTKTGDTTLVPGTDTLYTLKATNNGPDALSGAIQVIDTLPSGLSYLSGSGSGWTCSANAQVVTCNWPGTLANGALAPDLVITASVGAGVTGSLTNTAVLSGTGSDPTTGNNTASFTSGNFIPYFIFTNSACADGIAIGQAGQTCGAVTWTSMVAGQDETGIYITAVNASGVPTKLSSSGSTTVSTQFGLTCHDPIANAGVQATFTATAAALPLCTGSGADPASWSTATSLTFVSGAPSVATSYTFTYADVGIVELFMRNSVATSQVGKSGHFVVKPAGFVLSGIKCTTYAAGSCATAAIASPGNNPAAATAAGSAFIQAGQPFSVTVMAVNTSNVATPNFGHEQTREGVQLDAALVLPSGGNAAALNNASAFGSFVLGVATGTTFNWPEVGIITLTPSLADGDYLGAGDVVGTTTGNVGRFYPDHFALVSPLLVQGCDAGAFTYMDQPFSLTASIEAQNAASVKTQNYSGAAFAKGVISTQAENNNNGTALSSRITFIAPWAGGAASYAATKFARPVSASADATWGPFDALAFGATVTDSDGVKLINRNMDQSNTTCTADTSGTSDGSCPAVTLASGAKFRLGRLRMSNAYGSELLTLPVAFEAQYWAGNYYMTHTDDRCTVIPMPSITMGSYLGYLSACETQMSPTGSVTLAAGRLPGAGLVLSKPGAGNGGSVNLAINVTGVAAGTTCVGASETAATAANLTWFGPNQGARATFGIFKSPLIYRRENY